MCIIQDGSNGGGGGALINVQVFANPMFMVVLTGLLFGGRPELNL